VCCDKGFRLCVFCTMPFLDLPHVGVFRDLVDV